MAKHETFNPCAMGATFGVFFGLDLFLHALFAMNNWSWWWWNPGTFGLYQQAFPWIQGTLASALWGLVLGFVCGFICGYILVWIYNKVNAAYPCK
ncbi:MAG: hypothetical protein ACE5FT_02465 [Candidatus Nanoarchaeia archaeon]